MQRLSPPAHGAVELIVGLALLAMPFALGLGSAGLVVGVAAGVAVTGIALTSTVSLRTHRALDQVAVAALLGATLALAMHADLAGALLLGAAAFAELVLLGATRWTRRR
jgi:hypothetical protein